METIKIMQNYFMVENPLWIGKKTDAGIFIPEAARAKKNDEELQKDYEKMLKFKVLKTGPACTNIKTGDEVFVNPNIAISPNTIKVELNDKGYFLFREADVLMIY